MDFREHLVAELMRRCAKNEKYSLRAFARFLRVDHATLSQILRGKRALSATMTRKLAVRLGVGSDEIERFVSAPPSAAVVMGWQERAIHEHVRLENVVPDARWLAKVLDCSVDEVQIALHRLLRLGLVRMESRNRWVAGE